MILRLLGTGAADGIPGVYSESRISRIARERGGKDVRSRSAALVDGHLKIDWGPDTQWQIVRDRLDARDWTAVVYTHSHDDHFAPAELQYALFPFNDYEFAQFTIYANTAICTRIRKMYPAWPFEIVETRSFEPFRHMGYTITPIRAHHCELEDCHNLLIDDGEARLLYATDTGIWSEPTWEFLAGKALDLLVIECTEGVAPTCYAGHLDVEECIGVVDRLRGSGGLKPDARVVTTHHAHYGEVTHDELCGLLNPHGIEPGFDGMEIEVVRR